ncbi:putative oligopeptide transporter [Meyerozyma sp. JA9]|nr:putative oligopeptide transporter [Meyerozyma sp. JA9]
MASENEFSALHHRDSIQSASSNTIADDNSWFSKLETPQITFRATVVGLFIGSIVLISNFQFGLQTGWVSMMSLPSALLGYVLFAVSPWKQSFTDVENVYIQSIAVATGTGPLAYGLIGIVPAIEKFLSAAETGLGKTIKLSLSQLMVWSLGIALFGVFFAIPLRKQVVVKEKLPFPSGSATATLISVLHKTTLRSDEDSVSEETSSKGDSTYDNSSRSLFWTFVASSAFTVASYFIPILNNIPIFGPVASRTYMWNFKPSPAYIGQGIIMGLPTVSYMLFGAIMGWAVLAPFAKYKGWAPGDVDDWIEGGQGWILWISLSVMISDSIVSFAVVTFKSIRSGISFMNTIRRQDLEEQQSLLSNGGSVRSEQDVDSKFLVGSRTAIIGVVFSSLLCILSVHHVFGTTVPVYSTVVAIILALFFSILGVRALGETDLNPVSGIGKLSQLIFAFVVPKGHPARILINLIAGGIAEAGAQQAGDLMQDLKTGHLIGASPRAQFVAQIIGTLYSVVLSSVMYGIYNTVYEIPSDTYRIPTAVVWVDCARLVTGEGLPPMAFEFSIFFGVVFGLISLLKNLYHRKHKVQKVLVYLPNGVAVGVGIYNSPNFTLARFLGGLLAYWWIQKHGKQNKIAMIIFSSGLILGEGLFSGFTMLFTSLGVPHF